MAAIFQIRRGSGSVSLEDGELYVNKGPDSLQYAVGDREITLAKLDELNTGSLYLKGGISASGDITASNLYVSGNVVLGGTITIGDTTNDSVIFNADLSSSIIPDATNTYDLGSTSKVYRNVYATSISGAIAATNGVVSGSSQITYTSISSIPAGIVSGSVQVTPLLPTGVVSGSSQLTSSYDIRYETTGRGIISGSSQLNNTSIENLTVVNLTTVNETASVIFSSGSNRFGDFGNDVHDFTGSVKISGSITTIGSSTATSFNGTINANNGVVSGSTQITYASISSIPSGIVSGSSQVLGGTGIVSGSSQITYTSISSIPAGIVSGSTQVITLLPTGTVSGSTQVLGGTGIVSGSSQITYANISSIPAGIVSGSTQVITLLPTGVVSSSAQTIENLPTGTLSGSAQITTFGFVSSSVTASSLVTASVNINVLTFTKGNGSTFDLTVVASGTAPAGTISGSAQITTLGFISSSSVPAGTISGSAQIIENLPTGVVSGSSQITYTSISSIPSGIVSGAAQIPALLPTGVVSGSSQVITSNAITLGTHTTGNYIQTITGTANQITVAGSGLESADVTLSTPQDIHTSANVQFNSIGVGTAATAVAGEIRAINDITAFYSSDVRLKENIVPIENALSKVESISGNTYDWKEGFEEIHSHKGNDVGVIAQEIEKVLPQVVVNRENGYKAVDYEKIIPLLIESIKELSAKVKELENK